MTFNLDVVAYIQKAILPADNWRVCKSSFNKTNNNLIGFMNN